MHGTSGQSGITHGATNTPKTGFAALRCFVVVWISICGFSCTFYFVHDFHIHPALVSRSELFVNLNTFEAKPFASSLQTSLTPEFHRNNQSDSPELSNASSFGLRCSCLRFRSRRVSTAYCESSFGDEDICLFLLPATGKPGKDSVEYRPSTFQDNRNRIEGTAYLIPTARKEGTRSPTP